MRDQTGEVALVTSSSKDIGAGVAGDGARVVNHSRSAGDAAAIVARIATTGGEALAVKADIAEPGEIQPLVDSTLRRFGRLDILVNNAGASKPDTLDTITAESFDEHDARNVRGLPLTTQAAARVLPRVGVVF